MSVAITDDDDSLEASTLTSASLFLYWHDLEYFILETGQETVDDVSFLEYQRWTHGQARVAQLTLMGKEKR